MAGKEISSLVEEEKAIERELEECEKTLENIGSLAIRIQTFARDVRGLDPDDPEAERLDKQADVFSKAVLRLGSQRSRHKKEEQDEMRRSNIDFRREYMENTSMPQRATDEDFFSSSTQRINDVLMNAMDAFDTVRRQNVYINRTSERIRTGLRRIGLSKQLVDQIDRRYLSDRMVFIAGVVLTVLLFLLLRFFI